MTRWRGAVASSWSFVLFGFLVVFFFAMPLAAQDRSADGDDASRVLSLERLWNQAEVDRDAQALEHILADEFTFVDGDGSLQNKAEFLISVKNPPQHLATVGNESMTPRVYQNTVVVIGIYHEKGTVNGKPYSHRGRFTDTWIRQGSRWVCVASQSTWIQN